MSTLKKQIIADAISDGPFHTWGNSWPHWEELYKAEEWIYRYVKKYSLCILISKEKWGSLRYEWVFPPFARKQWRIKIPFLKKKTPYGDFPYYLFYWQTSFIYNLWRWWGYKMLNRAVNKACIKFPNVVAELKDDLEWR